jgi:hypothetical protein
MSWHTKAIGSRITCRSMRNPELGNNAQLAQRFIDTDNPLQGLA